MTSRGWVSYYLYVDICLNFPYLHPIYPMASVHSYQIQDFQVKKLGGLPKSPSKWYCHIETKPVEI